MKKSTISRILIPMDFSETGQLALEHGAFMASLFKADLYLLHVMELLEYPYSIYEPMGVPPLDTEEIQKNITASLNEQAEKIRKQYGLHVTSLISRGRVALEVAEVSKNNNIDLIVMGTHGTKGFEEFFVGSNAHRVVTLSSCPVITVQTHAKKTGFNTIVMPIDNALHSRQKVDQVIELANRYGSFIHLLGLIKEDEDLKKFMIKIESVEKALKHANLEYECKIIKGNNIAVTAMNYSDKVNADLIVTMTDHESHLNGIFLGPFAKQIINHSKTPVLSIRPIEGIYESQGVGSNPYY
jgi:nucleotide-binding universal stress UspA family protein